MGSRAINDFFCSECNEFGIIFPVSSENYDRFLESLEQHDKKYLQLIDLKNKFGQILYLPPADDRLRVVVVHEAGDYSIFASLAEKLPAGSYKIESNAIDLEKAAFNWALGHYRFNRYLAKQQIPKTQLCFSPSEECLQIIEAIFLVRDLINTPAQDLNPAIFAEMMVKFAKAQDLRYRVYEGKELQEEFPMVNAVGKGAEVQPRVAVLSWGDPKLPKVALVGKGICFDSGGLDIKTKSGMALMKKDMGGAAHAFALAQLLIKSKLPIAGQLVIPLAENAVSANAYHPGDVLTARNGTTVEITNTDAEGRLVLADALSYAQEGHPDLLIDFATLTGAARVAMGPDIAPYFTLQDDIADGIEAASNITHESVCRLPLYQPYRKYLASSIADLSNASSVAYAGAITAALFLQHFIQTEQQWLHFDIFAWCENKKPGYPEGASAQMLLTVYQWLKTRYNRHTH